MPTSAPAWDPGFLQQFAATQRFALGQPKAIVVAPDGKVLFLRSGARSPVQDLYELDPATGEERVILTAGQLLDGGEEVLSAEELARRERMRMSSRGIASFALSKDGRRLLVPLSGRLFAVDRETSEATELRSDAGYAIDPQLSPDGALVACARGADVYVTDVATGRETRLTHDGGGTVTNGQAEYVAQEEMHRFHGLWWSPDSRFVAYEQADTTGLELFRIADPMHPEKEPQTWPYPRPGKKNAVVRLGVVAASGGPTTWVEWDRERYPYLAQVVWSENAPLTLLVQNREQTEEVLLAADPSTGRTVRLLTETDPAWVNLVPSVPRWLKSPAAATQQATQQRAGADERGEDDPPPALPEADRRTGPRSSAPKPARAQEELGEGFLWMTERGGAWQLELRGGDGSLVRTLTSPSLGLHEVVDVDEDAGTILVVASGDAVTERHLWTVSLSGDVAPSRLTSEPGVHGAIVGKGTRVVVSSTLAGKASWRVQRGSTPSAMEDVAEVRSVGESPSWLPNATLEAVDVDVDGVPLRMHAVVLRPRDYVEGRTYPVIVQVYGGPHVQVVLAQRRAWFLQQWYADHGFVVVSLDGRGTPGRGREWERAVKGDLIDRPLADQVAGLKALAARHPEMDLDRVGMTGWSFGGYFSAMAAMRRPDVYRAGVAGAPVVDWLDYDTHYTERYMGLPDANPEGYRAANVLTWCDRLERPLLIVHGTADDNVYFLHSLRMTDALFRAGKAFEFLPLAGFTHMVPDPLVTERLYSRVVAFFETNLR